MTEQQIRVISPEQQFDFVALPGQTVNQLIKQLPDWQAHESYAVYNHGQFIADTDSYIVNDGDRLIICLVPQGGGGGGSKGILGIVAAVAIIAVAWWNPMGWAAAGGLLTTSSLYAVGAGLLLSSVGTMLAPRPDLGTGNTAPSSQREVSNYFLTGQSNSVRLYQPVLVAYGQNKMYPALAANPNIINIGVNSTFDALYDFGIGEQSYDLGKIKFGETLASQYAPQYYQHTNTKKPNLKLITNRYGYDNFNVTLQQNQPFTAITKANAITAEANIAFNQGLYSFDNNGNIQTASIGLEVSWRPVGGSTWTPVEAWSFFGGTVNQNTANEVSVSGSTTAPFIVIASMVFPTAGTYEVKINRTTAISSDSRTQTTALFNLLESRITGNVLNLSAPHTMLEMRVKASDKLNGVVQDLSVICTSVLNTYDAAGNMVGRIATRNPAWIAIDILTGKGNPRPIRMDQIDWPAWKRLADICDTPRTWLIGGESITSPRFTCDVVIDYETTVKQLIESVLSTCRSGLTIGLNGRYSVMFDGERTIPRQIITPSNSWNFSASRQFPPEVHALKVSFIDADSDYKKQEVIVYNDGYSFSSAEKFEDVGTFGITDYAHAWAFGRYQMAAAINRAEVFSVTMDVENLACQRGDLVQVAHDVPMVGGQPAYVVSVNGNAIEVTETYSTAPNSYTIRLSDGTIRQGMLVAVINGNTFELDNTAGIMADDLIVLGDSQRLIKEYVVSQVSPSLDLSATLTLLPYIREVYDADIGSLPVWKPEISQDLINATNLAITSLNIIGQGVEYVDRYPQGTFEVRWDVNNQQIASYYELKITTADGISQVISDLTDQYYKYEIDLLKNPSKMGQITFEVTPFTVGGIPGTGKAATATVSQDIKTPSPVNWFLANVQDSHIVFAWEPPTDLDIAGYEIRYSPDIAGADWDQSQIIGRFPHNVYRATAGARTGSYGIVVKDTTGNYSEIVGRITTIENLESINLITNINEADAWPGNKAAVVVDNQNIVLAGEFGAVAPEGYYYYQEILDLGDVYEIRIASKIKAFGMAPQTVQKNTASIFEIDGKHASAAAPRLIEYNSPQSNQYSIILEVRSADKVSAIKDWVPLSIAVPISAPAGDQWTAWRPCEVGDFTGRLFQFRLRLQSFDPNIKAGVMDGLIEIDVRDRIDRYNDVIVPDTGLTLNFNPAFMDTPTLSITTENSYAVRYVITNKNKVSFNVKLFDVNDAQVAGQIDVLALGYGKKRATSI